MRFHLRVGSRQRTVTVPAARDGPGPGDRPGHPPRAVQEADLVRAGVLPHQRLRGLSSGLASSPSRWRPGCSWPSSSSGCCSSPLRSAAPGGSAPGTGPWPATSSTSASPTRTRSSPGPASSAGWSCAPGPGGWRALAYAVIKIPLVIFGIWFALSVWMEAFCVSAYPMSGGSGGVSGFGPFRNGIGVHPVGPGPSGPLHPELLFLYGALLVFARPVADAAGRLHRPPAHAPPARPRRPDRPGALPRAGPGADRRRLGRHAAPHRAGPPRRHPGPTGGPGHAARPGQGEAGRRRTTSISTRSASWSTRPTAAPRRPSSSCATWPEASTRRRSTSAWRARWPPWPPAPPCRPS